MFYLVRLINFLGHIIESKNLLRFSFLTAPRLEWR